MACCNNSYYGLQCCCPPIPATTSSTTTTTLCPNGERCDEVVDPRCIIYNGPDIPCYGIETGDSAADILNIIISYFNCPPTTTTTTSSGTTTTTTTPATTTTTTGGGGTTTTTTSGGTTTTTTSSGPCECIVYIIENLSGSTAVVPFTNCVTGLPDSITILAGGSASFCACSGSVPSSPGVTPIALGPCPTTTTTTNNGTTTTTSSAPTTTTTTSGSGTTTTTTTIR